MAIFFNVKETSQSISKELKSYNSGKVHSVYKRTINILLKEKMVSIQPQDLPNTPMFIGVDIRHDTFDLLNIEKDDQVIFKPDRFIINNHEFNHSSSLLWDPKLNYIKLALEDFNPEKTDFLSNLLKIYGRREGLRDLVIYLYNKKLKNISIDLGNNRLTAKALSLVKAGMESIISGKSGDAAKSISGLIGMGPGLTPSGDDFLTGFLSVLLSVDIDLRHLKEFQKDLIKQIKNSLNKTTFLGGEFLKYACIGEFSQPFHQFYISFKSTDKAKIASSTINFLKLGHSSGSDSVSGIITGMLIINELIKKHF